MFEKNVIITFFLKKEERIGTPGGLTFPYHSEFIVVAVWARAFYLKELSKFHNYLLVLTIPGYMVKF